jgi:hypothetical protein
VKATTGQAEKEKPLTNQGFIGILVEAVSTKLRLRVRVKMVSPAVLARDNTPKYTPWQSICTAVWRWSTAGSPNDAVSGPRSVFGERLIKPLDGVEDSPAAA